MTRGTVTHGWLNTTCRETPPILWPSHTRTPSPRYTPTHFVPHTQNLSFTHTQSLWHIHQHPHTNTSKLTYTTSHSKTPSSWHSFSQLDIRLYNITVRWRGVNNHSGRTVPKNDFNPMIESYRSHTWSSLSSNLVSWGRKLKSQFEPEFQVRSHSPNNMVSGHHF